MSNLKEMLMRLGNGLVEKGFHPPDERVKRVIVDAAMLYRDTTLIAAFTEYLNQSDDAVAVLEEMGIEYPRVKPQPKVK